MLLSVLVYIFSTSTNQNVVNANGNGDENRFYGCTKYNITHSIHCDPLMNRLVGYSMPSDSDSIYTNSGTPVFVPSKHGLGLELVAKRSERVEFADTSILHPNKFSISFWIKNSKDMQPTATVISHQIQNTSGSIGWSLDTYWTRTSSTQTIVFSVFDETGQRFSSSPATISNDTFTHIVGTFDGDSMKIYRNGIQIGHTAFNAKYISDPQIPLTMGSPSYCFTCNYWSGVIDDVRFYNRAINGKEVKEIFSNDSIGIVPDGLAGYWTFENNLHDISGNKNEGNLDSMITSAAFAPDGRLFFDEKNTGKIRIMKDDKVLSTPFAIISNAYISWEQGLLGLAIDPKFEQNHFVYLYYTAVDNKTGQAQIFNRLVRFTENNDKGTDTVVLLDKIPASIGYHSGGALAFGADDKLYIGVGDATEHEFAQDPGIAIGKVLRINRDGTIPPDNPFPKSPIYTIGHRNIFGIAFDKKDHIGIITEDGDFHYDEINLLQKGGNYGFPTMQPPNIAPELFTNNSSIKPLISYWQTIVPTQAIYYDGDRIPQLKNKFLVATFDGNIYALTLDERGKHVTEQEKVATRHFPFEPIIFITQSPSGDIYYGGYHIYKLKSVYANSKIQDLFPIEIMPSFKGIVKDMQASYNGSSLTVSVYARANTNNKERSFSSSLSSLQLSIPRAIINHISSVTIHIIRNPPEQPSVFPVNFILNENSSLNNNAITIPFKSGINNSQVIIKGVSSTNDIYKIEVNNNNRNNASSVSIVQYASYSSTLEPYDPSTLYIDVGNTVKWMNNDFIPHTVTEGESTIPENDTSHITDKFDSGILGPGQKFDHAFHQAGTFKYYCTIHPFMSGEVIVK
jgi:glucose/arabinose dehydrogenase/plastocyanin